MPGIARMAEYECEDNQTRVLLETRIVAHSAWRQMSEPTATSARSAGGEGRTGGGQRACRRLDSALGLNSGMAAGHLGVVVAGDLPAAVSPVPVARGAGRGCLDCRAEV